jgi:hypothetical protein
MEENIEKLSFLIFSLNIHNVFMKLSLQRGIFQASLAFSNICYKAALGN